MNLSSEILIDFLISFDDAGAFHRIDHIFKSGAANDAIAKALDLFAAFDNR